MRINAVRTSFESPWQNGVAERWVGSCRSELLDHVIALNERHLKRLLSEYVSYHHEDRTHLGLGKGTPGCRTRCLLECRLKVHAGACKNPTTFGGRHFGEAQGVLGR